MIVFFHFIFLISKYLLTALSKSFNHNRDLPDSDSDSDSNFSESDENLVYLYQQSIGSESRYLNGELRFTPPVYIQRYEAVCSLLQQSPWKENLKKVVDFGCSDLGFFHYLKHIPGVEEILEVDIDETALDRGVSRAAPLNSDYLFCKRAKPLNVYILSGDITEYDDYLQGTDAVVAIEVIEHLYPDILEKVPWSIFHDIKPKVAVFTTPNADFNALFPSSTRFRHPDHKFEWSRKEFYKWSRKITKKYPNYSVQFYGVGIGPQGSENLGCCTQMAVFTKSNSLEYDSPVLERKAANNYKLIRKYKYPFFVDERTDEEKIVDEVIYRVKFTINDAEYYNNEDDSAEIPLSNFMDYISKWCNSEEELKKILLDHGFYVKEREGCSFLVYCAPSNPSYREDEESSVDYSIWEDVQNVNLTAENWEEDCGDGNFNESLTGKVPDDELTCFLTARSLPEMEKSEVLSEMEHGPDVSNGNPDCNALPDKLRSEIPSSSWPRIASSGRIRNKKFRESFLRNSSRILVRFLSAPSDFEIDLREDDLSQIKLSRSSSDPYVYNVETG